MNPEFRNAKIFDNTSTSILHANIQAQLRETVLESPGVSDSGFKHYLYKGNDIYFITYVSTIKIMKRITINDSGALPQIQIMLTLQSNNVCQSFPGKWRIVVLYCMLQGYFFYR